MAAWLQLAGITRPIDTRILDFSTNLSAEPPSPDIVIVGIDDASLAEVGSWPWPRETHAKLLNQISAAGAKQIIYDVLFLEQTNPASDASLARSIAQAGNVILPHTFGEAQNGETGVVPLYPMPEFAESAVGIGHAAAAPDDDGLLRRFDLEFRGGADAYPQMMVSAYRSQGVSGQWLEELISSPKRTNPIVPFAAIGGFTTIPASEVLAGRMSPEFLDDKIILVGATAQGMGDRYSVSAKNRTFMTGVETQANLLNTIMTESFVDEVIDLWPVIFACLILLLQFLAFWRLPPRLAFLVTIALIVVAGLVAIALVPLFRLWIAPAPAMAMLLISYPFWSWRRLVSVSSFLEAEAKLLPPLAGELPKEGSADGFDVIARQVDRMKSLVRHVNSNFVFLRQIIDAAPDPIIVLDREERVDNWNEMAMTLFPDWDLSQQPHFSELFLNYNVVVNQQAGEIETADGRTFLLARGPLAVDSDGDSGEVLVLREISEQRRQEVERQQMLEFLSHDMRNPQVAIIGLAERSADAIDGQERLGRIRLQAERTLKLADDFVQLARLEETTLVYEEVDLVSLAEECCDRTFSIARRKKITVDQTMPEDPVYAEIEPSLIARMLDNLLGNALKFSPENSVVTVKVERCNDGHVLLEVADQGPGLPPERIEDPFARFGAHDTKAGPSLGLGLAFVQRTVDKHNGLVEVVSSSRTGTVFQVLLPELRADNGSVAG